MSERIIALDPGDAKFMALIERFSERLDWVKADGEQRNRQLELQAGTLAALEKGMSRMEGMVSAMRDELRATAALSARVVDAEMRLQRLEDESADIDLELKELRTFKDNVMNKLALIGLAAFVGGGSVSAVAMKLLTGG